MKKWKIVIVLLLIILFILLLGTFFYVNDYYRANDEVYKFLESDDFVTVKKEKDVYIFDGYGEDNAIVFYQGGKVDNIAYSKLLYDLALNGVDCFLVNMPFRLAILDKNVANSIISNYSYNNWYIMGHSLGGTVASMYVSSNVDKVKGLIMLAAYPTSEINDNVKVLSIYGSLDCVLNMKKYESAKKYWNTLSYEYIINGGNHAYFGNYGEQSGDCKASITSEEQQKQVVREVINFIVE